LLGSNRCRIVLAVFLLASVALVGCRKRPAQTADPDPAARRSAGEHDEPATADLPQTPAGAPVADGDPAEGAAGDDLPRFASNSPFDSSDSTQATSKPPKRLWADSFLWEKAPALEVGQWLGEAPQMEGKYLLVECWATWCPPCRRSLPKLNAFHRKYKDALVVIGICEEAPEVVRKFMAETPLEFYVAADPQMRFKKALGVYGIPHVVIIEPEEGIVIWEGFPLQEGYELTEVVIDHILDVGRKRGVLPSGS